MPHTSRHCRKQQMQCRLQYAGGNGAYQNESKMPCNGQLRKQHGSPFSSSSAGTRSMIRSTVVLPTPFRYPDSCTSQDTGTPVGYCRSCSPEQTAADSSNLNAATMSPTAISVKSETSGRTSAMGYDPDLTSSPPFHGRGSPAKKRKLLPSAGAV